MAQQRQRFSPRDEVYLNSPGFELYMVAGGVFIAIFTAGFLLGVRLGMAWLVWPGLAVAALACGLTLWLLTRRERARKLAELEAESQDEAQPLRTRPGVTPQ